MAFPIQGTQCKTKKFRFIGQILDAWVGNAINDTTSVTVSSNGTAKQYNIQSVTPITQGLKQYHVLIINVWAYITLSSGSSSGSATISVIINGTTATSVTISNTSNEQVIAFVTNENTNGWQVGNIPSHASNNIQIQVSLGTGAQSVTITQVQILDVIQINGGTSGTTVSLPYSGTFDYYNEDPTVIIAPLWKVSLGYWIYANTSAGVVFQIQGSSVGSQEMQWTGTYSSSFTMPANISNDTASGTISIQVPANASIQLLQYWVFVSYSGRYGVTFPDGESVQLGAIGFVKGVVYLQQEYFMFLPTGAQLGTSHYQNLEKLVGILFPSQYYGLPISPNQFNSSTSSPGSPNYNISQILQPFTAVFIGDNSVFHICCEELAIILVILAEVIV